MRRQKRDMSDRAYHKGYQAGFKGRHREDCPHTQAASREHWLAGWREGRNDHWEGLNTFASEQKQALQ